MNAATSRPIDPHTRIGHVHLKVANIERALWFYRDILGFEITQWYGDDAVFLSAGGYHHHIGLNVWASLGGPPAPEDSAGLEYFEVVVPSAEDLRGLAVALAQEGAGFSEVQTDDGRPAIRPHDPDRIGLLISAQAA